MARKFFTLLLCFTLGLIGGYGYHYKHTKLEIIEGRDARIERDLFTSNVFNPQSDYQLDNDFVEKYEQKANDGDPKSQFMLGVMHYFGLGNALENHTKAVYWWQRAAQHDYGYAQSNLGVMYQYGRGVSDDKELAYAWFNIAITNIDEPLFNKPKKLRDKIAISLTDEEKNEGDLLVAQCLKSYTKCIDT